VKGKQTLKDTAKYQRYNMIEDIKGIKEYCDATANEWAEKWYGNETMLPLLQKFVDLYAVRPRILDAGCGAGYESMRLFNLGADVVGVDISEESIKIARSRNPKCLFEVMDCKKWDRDLGLFDGIVSLALLIHIEACDLQEIFRNYRKNINSSGFLFVAFVDGDGFDEKRSYIEVDGVKYNRATYLHPVKRIIENAISSAFEYYDEWYLTEPIGQWKFLVFRAL